MLPRRPLTDGVVALRPWQVQDAEWYVAQIADADIQRFTAEPPELLPEAVRAAIEDMHVTQAHAGLAITDAASGTLLGNAGLARDETGIGNISYWVAPDARGRGAATRAVRLLVNWAWECGLRRVQLHVRVDNVGSQRVAEKAGLRRERVEHAARVAKGQEWDVVWYGLSRPAEAVT